MAYIYMMLCIGIMPLQNVCKKIYQRRSNGKGGAYLFTVLLAVAAALFFAVVGLADGGYHYEIGVLPYSLAFGIGYALCSFASTVAFTKGSMAITALIVSYSLVLPTLYGFLFLHEDVTVFKVIGLSLLLLSLYLVNSSGIVEGGERKKFSWTWLVLATVAFVFNGLISIIQSEQQLKFEGAYRNEFMLVSLLVVIVCLLPLVLVFERVNLGQRVRAVAAPALLCGILNGGLNLFVMLALVTLSRSLFFPVLCASSTVLNCLISVIVYKERFTRLQWSGMVLGVGALIFLNL